MMMVTSKTNIIIICNLSIPNSLDEYGFGNWHYTFKMTYESNVASLWMTCWVWFNVGIKTTNNPKKHLNYRMRVVILFSSPKLYGRRLLVHSNLHSKLIVWRYFIKSLKWHIIIKQCISMQYFLTISIDYNTFKQMEGGPPDSFFFRWFRKS